MRFRVCTECRARCKPNQGRYCYFAPLRGHRRWDWVCNECRRLIRMDARREEQS